MMRRVAAALLFAALLVSGIRVSVLRLLLPPFRPPDVPGPVGGVDRKPLRFRSDPIPPDVLQFLEVARSRTKPGERVAPLMAWPHNGLGYSFWRVSYALTGRPVQFPMDVVPPDDPDVIILWQSGYGHPDYALDWTQGNGAILRKTK
jgi:hypothetical protein